MAWLASVVPLREDANPDVIARLQHPEKVPLIETALEYGPRRSTGQTYTRSYITNAPPVRWCEPDSVRSGADQPLLTSQSAVTRDRRTSDVHVVSRLHKKYGSLLSPTP